MGMAIVENSGISSSGVGVGVGVGVSNSGIIPTISLPQ